MHLREFFDYKNKLMEQLLTNPSIVSLVKGGASSISEEDCLAYKQFFPFEYLPETVEEAKTFVCFDVDIQKSSDRMLYYPTINIWVFAHKSLMRLPQGGVRVDEICSEISSMINGSLEYGLGELSLYSVRRFAPITDYIGKQMTFQAVDFSRVYNANKTIPSNRKGYNVSSKPPLQ